jgi:hypothetical protein
MRRLMFFAVALTALAPSVAARAQDCFPPCRDGYLCHRGQCVSACNPVCGADERCTSDGQCVSQSSAATAPPAHSGAATAPPAQSSYPQQGGAPQQAELQYEVQPAYQPAPYAQHPGYAPPARAPSMAFPMSMLMAGAVFIIIGTPLVVLASGSDYDCYYYDDCYNYPMRNAGFAFIGLGSILLPVGTIFTIIQAGRRRRFHQSQTMNYGKRFDLTPTFSTANSQTQFGLSLRGTF